MNIHNNTCWDLLYSQQRNINKRRAFGEGIYPVKKLGVTKSLAANEKSDPQKIKLKPEGEQEQIDILKIT